MIIEASVVLIVVTTLIMLVVVVVVLLLMIVVRITSYNNINRIIINNRYSMKYSINNDNIDINVNEWNALLEAEKDQRDVFEEAIKNKLKEWKELKDAGVLDKLAEDPDMYDDINTNNNNIRLPSSSRSNDNSDDVDNKSITYFQEKYNSIISKKKVTSKQSSSSSSKSSSISLSLYQLLNEMKDKEQYNTMLIQSIILSLAKNDDASYSIAAINLYKKLLNENIIDNSTPRYLMSVVLACFLSNNIKNGDAIMNNLISDNIYSNDDFLPSLVCKAIANCHSESSKSSSKKSSLGKLLSKKKEAAAPPMDPEVSKAQQDHRLSILNELKTNIKKYPIDELNKVVRMLGRYQYIDDVFSFIDTMNSTPSTNANEETYEFLTNSLVYTVDETAKASSMTELPTISNAPEILFAGRSNVGKSSLVNFLVNRKALASTSATPGHTKQFHFFHINKDYENVPSFYFVDVPGLGYAEAEDGQKDSWRYYYHHKYY